MKKAMLIASLVLFGACVHPTPRNTPASSDAMPRGPVAVRLLQPKNGALQFLTSEPAYVAIFEIVPEFGISMLFPWSEARASSVGLNTAYMQPYVAGRSYYAHSRNSSTVLNWKARYLFIIASRSPLPVDDIRLVPLSLRQTLGWESFLANDLSGTLGELERLLAGSLPKGDWSSHLYVVSPDPLSERPLLRADRPQPARPPPPPTQPPRTAPAPTSRDTGEANPAGNP